MTAMGIVQVLQQHVAYVKLGHTLAKEVLITCSMLLMSDKNITLNSLTVC